MRHDDHPTQSWRSGAWLTLHREPPAKLDVEDRPGFPRRTPNASPPPTALLESSIARYRREQRWQSLPGCVPWNPSRIRQSQRSPWDECVNLLGPEVLVFLPPFRPWFEVQSVWSHRLQSRSEEH